MAASEVEFHTGVADPPVFAARLLRKAYRLGARVLVTAPAARLQVLDRLLWTGDDGEFVPHAVLPSAAPRVWQRSPLWLAEGVDQAAAATTASAQAGLPPVLINLGAEAPVAARTEPVHAESAGPTPDMSRFERLIEIVGIEPEEVAAGRERWRAYKTAGLAVRHLPAGGG